MLPLDSAYGGWPRSGEIDVMEARGNSEQSSCGPSEYRDDRGFGSTLHFGPDSANNGLWHTHTQSHLKTRKPFSEDFHVFGLDWTPEGLYTYLDSPENRVLKVDFRSESMWQRGQARETVCSVRVGGKCTERTPLKAAKWPGDNIYVNGTRATPFDQPFFLQINLAVGGTTS